MTTDTVAMGMTTGEWAFVILVITTVLAGVICRIGIKISYKEGWEDGRQYEANRNNERRLRDAARARADRASPRPAPPWYVQVTASRVMHGGIGGPATIPMAHRHAPARPVTLADTGEFRAAVRAGTDLYIDHMQADEETWRRTHRLELTR